MHLNDTTNNTPKLCECGCGQLANIATKNNTKRGHVIGQYYRFLRGHNPKRPVTPIEDRFWAKVIKRGPDECWGWTGTRTYFGYGQIGDRKGRSENAHRTSYRIHYGPIPEGMDVCHTCDNPICVNPAHLWVGTRAENLQDMTDKGRRARIDQKGMKAPSRKLTESDVLRIRELYAQGIPPIRIAEQFGVTSSNIVAIAKRRTWSHI